MLDWMEYLPRLAAAMGAGLLIGWERQYRRQFAGIRTNLLIAVGACLFVLFSSMDESGGDRFRIAAQVVSGIGFLSGGVIVREGFTVHGLTTAATLWCTAAVGVAAGGGFYELCGVATAMILATNILLRPLSKKLSPDLAHHDGEEHHGLPFYTYRIDVLCRREREYDLRDAALAALQKAGMQLLGIRAQDGPEPESLRLSFTAKADREQAKIVEATLRRLCHEFSASGEWAVVPAEAPPAHE